MLKEVPAGATAVGIPARIIKAELPSSSNPSSQAQFSAYGITPEADDPMSLAMKSLIDVTLELEAKVQFLERSQNTKNEASPPEIGKDIHQLRDWLKD